MWLAAPSRLAFIWQPLSRQVRLFTTSLAPTTPGPQFAKFTVFKGRTAMGVKIIPGKFRRTSYGVALTRGGVLLLEFAPKIQGTERQYDWKNSIIFGLKPSECGELLAGNFGEKGIAFVHNPALRQGAPPEPMKTLRLSKAPEGKGFFIVAGVGGGASFSLPLTAAEFEVLKVLMRHGIPRMLGFAD
eukprot:EG_transcript_27932